MADVSVKRSIDVNYHLPSKNILRCDAKYTDRAPKKGTGI